MRLRQLILTTLLAIGCIHAARAQTPAQPEPGSEIAVTLVTFGLAQEVTERFGHNALWFHDEITKSDVAYHWGLYSFKEPHFLLRFLTGDNQYWMAGVDAIGLVEGWRQLGRPVTLQRLNLTPLQALKLRDFVRWNAREENKYYRYDYYQDNCSTRLRDALDMAIGGAIRRSSDSVMTPFSYRRESVRLTDGDRPIQTGIDIALGRPADKPLTQWQSFFIPMRLRDAVRTIKIPGPDGSPVPLVLSEQTPPLPVGVIPVEELSQSPSIAWRTGLLGVLLAGLVIGLRIMMVSRRSAAWGLALFGATWSLLCGVIGVILLLAWFATKHVFWAWNESALLLSPLSLLLVILIPASILRKRAMLATGRIAATVALLALVAFMLAMAATQENRAVAVLFLPVHLALAWALGLKRLKS